MCGFVENGCLEEHKNPCTRLRFLETFCWQTGLLNVDGKHEISIKSAAYKLLLVAQRKYDNNYRMANNKVYTLVSSMLFHFLFSTTVIF